MAQYDGYRTVPHDSYQQFRDATLNNGWNVDFYAGNQCWDLPALLYFQYGLPLLTGNGTAAGCWNLKRQENSRQPFISITGAENIKRGDILVWNSTSFVTTGHIAFADEDFNGTNFINCLGQNQGQGTAAPANIANVPLNNFLGIFRNTAWNSEKPKTNEKRKFPWPIAWEHWDNFRI